MGNIEVSGGGEGYSHTFTAKVKWVARGGEVL
jgi:hypothetical protein